MTPKKIINLLLIAQSPEDSHGFLFALELLAATFTTCLQPKTNSDPKKQRTDQSAG
jgi:hypothetical protein